MSRCAKLMGFLFLWVMVWALAGCTVTPQPVYRAHPEEGSGIWNNGSELSVVAQSGVETVAAFQEPHRYRLIFLVEVANDSDRPLTVDPARFYLASAAPEAVTDTARSYRCLAFDPEEQILKGEMSRSQAEARRQEQLDTDMFFSLVTMVASVAEAGKEVTPEQAECSRQKDEEIAQLQEEEEWRHRETMQALDRRHYLWSQETLRKTTLAPGQMIGGLVRFRICSDDSLQQLVLPLDELELVHPFKVEKHQPPSRRY
jgi:hypothetical protein